MTSALASRLPLGKSLFVGGASQLEVHSERLGNCRQACIRGMFPAVAEYSLDGGQRNAAPQRQ